MQRFLPREGFAQIIKNIKDGYIQVVREERLSEIQTAVFIDFLESGGYLYSLETSPLKVRINKREHRPVNMSKRRYFIVNPTGPIKMTKVENV